MTRTLTMLALMVATGAHATTLTTGLLLGPKAASPRPAGSTYASSPTPAALDFEGCRAIDVAR